MDMKTHVEIWEAQRRFQSTTKLACVREAKKAKSSRPPWGSNPRPQD
ncbi:hypothetical protein Pcac1_g19071 [Phytophthora cactorum]|nr:hypothetical protein Pcac1_g19071 [Phytophthora cactorum]